MLLSTIVAATASGSGVTAGAAHAVASAAILSASAPASPLGWLISRTRSAKVRWSAARPRSGATMAGSTTNVIVVYRESRRTKISLGFEERRRPGARSRCPTCRCSGRRPVNSRSTVNEPGPRGSSDDPNAAARPRQCYYRPSPTAFAAERQAVGRTWHLGWSSEVERW
jgi:hypothetical protein